MSGLTKVERIVSERTGSLVRSGQLAVVSVDGAMATDTTAPLAIQSFYRMGGRRIWDQDRFALVIDHAAPAPNQRIAELHRMMRTFSKEQNIHLYEVGEGICHQLMVESGRVQPGYIFTGADSHTPTYAAVNSFSMGIGSTDLAAVMKTGKIWIKVPETILIHIEGILPIGTSPKDLVLFLTGRLTISGATYCSVEFQGSTIASLSLSGRMCVANMLAEMGAKTGFMDTDGLDIPYQYGELKADYDAVYKQVYHFHVDGLPPQLAAPHSPDQVVSVEKYTGQKVDYGFIGTCGNGRLEDLQSAAKVLQGKKIKRGLRLIIAPASRSVFMDAITDGTVQILMEAGATFITPGCGPCVGTHQGVPGDGETVISAANRNFQGRMGNPGSSIFLAAPATVAASMVTGEITHPKELL
ncbi:MAG TPA: 3-isopropylmalate dehydratase large subunit [Saprospiraceae bacterium]|nr:3-isopropylmalate dehydratase large subunit [Saprospiraceae bacterium]